MQIAKPPSTASQSACKCTYTSMFARGRASTVPIQGTILIIRAHSPKLVKNSVTNFYQGLPSASLFIPESHAYRPSPLVEDPQRG
eukprot:2555819-Pleurochrysis_carterae.AAC.1